MSCETILQNVNDSIARREYVIGAEKQYYILTIKIHGQQYEVMVVDHHKVIETVTVNDRLEAAKKAGLNLLFHHFPQTSQTDFTMVHYKDDRPSGKPWIKEKEIVITYLISQLASNPFPTMNMQALQHVFSMFATYRKGKEDQYLSRERTYKLELLEYLGSILHQLRENPEKMKSDLLQLVTGKLTNTNLVRYLDNLLSAMKGFADRDDFRVFLENTPTEEMAELLSELFDYGLTTEIRSKFDQRYKTLYEKNKFATAKKTAPSMRPQFLAILLSSYEPEEYILYKPTEYQTLLDHLGVQVPAAVVEKYDLFKRFAHFLVGYAQAHHFPVHDLIDAHNMVYMFSQYEEFETLNLLEGESHMTTKNLILYGPPGTGKTYNVIYKSLEILDPTLPPDLLENPSRRTEAVQLFNKYVENNQVKFCTFHQSYSYEEFVEGIRFSEEGQGFEVKDGMIKEICAAARTSISDRKTVYDFDPDSINFFKMSLGNVNENNDDKYNYCIENNVIALGWGGDVDYTKCTNKQAIQKAYQAKYPHGESFGIEAMERFKHWIKQGDIVIVSYGNTQVRAIGKIIGDYTYNPNSPIDYNHFRAVEWLYKDVKIPVQKILKEKVFSQQTIYMFYKKDINMEALKELLSTGDHTRQNDPQYVLVIDEINRGNISKIFGELITLIEPDKRIGSINETWVTLPYSGERFGIPNNIHILGTMNTADRSIALLDTALRRRFEFIEMMPAYELLPEDVESINVRKMLRVMNERIEYLYDRDHVIGHSYFITDNPTATFYLQVMLKKVIPLLQEYFYENWEYIELVLGGAGKADDQSCFLIKSLMQSDKLFSVNSRITEQQKLRYIVNPNPSPDALRNIYKNVGKEVEE